MARSVRGGTAVALVLALLTPASLASAPDPSDSRAAPPCLHVDATTIDPRSGEARHTEGAYPPGPCDGHQANFTWNASPREGWGDLELRVRAAFVPSPLGCVPAHWKLFQPSPCPYDIMSAEPPAPFDASPWGALRRWVRGWIGPAEDAPPAPAAARLSGPEPANGSFVVKARFRVAWDDSGCAGSRGEVDVSIDGETVLGGPPLDLLESLCRLSRSDAPTLASVGAAAAGVAAFVLDAVPDAGPLQAALAALAAVEPPRTPGLPDAPPTGGLAATGDALVNVTPGEGAAVEGALESEGPVHPSAQVALSTRGPTDAPLAAPPGVDLAPAASPSLAPAPEARKAAPPRPALPAAAPRGATLPAPAPAPAPPAVVRVQAAVAAREEAKAATLAAHAAAWGMLALLGFALYQRLRRPAALDHPARAALYAACAARERGATARELAEAAGLGRATAEYHLVYLARLGLLRADRDAARRRLFAPLAAPRPAEAEPLARRVVGLVRARGEVPLPEITAALDVTRTRADRCVKDLLLDGKLASRWKDGGRLYFLPEA